jgi:hypothetical protein
LYIYNLSEDFFDPVRDNRDLLVADYYTDKNVYTLDIVTPSNIEIPQNGIHQINVIARVNGNPTSYGIVYTSSDNKIATINPEGLITALEEGSLEITVTFQGITRTINVNIVEVKTILQPTVRITHTGDATVRLGGANKTFNAEFFGSDGLPMSDIAQWQLFDPITSSVPAYITVVSQTSTSIVIRAQGAVNLVGRIFILRVTGTSGFAVSEIPVEVVSLM